MFPAISYPSGGGLLALLAEGDRPVKRLSEAFDIFRPTVSQHLWVLLYAGLVSERKVGRERRYTLRPDGLREVSEWIAQYEPFWEARLWA